MDGLGEGLGDDPDEGGGMGGWRKGFAGVPPLESGGLAGFLSDMNAPLTLPHHPPSSEGGV